VASELLPGVKEVSTDYANGYRYGMFLNADDFGSGYAGFHYGESPDCALSDQLRRNAAAQGWQDLRRMPGAPCDGWRAERDGFTATLTHRPHRSSLLVRQAAPGRFGAITLGCALLGAAAGAALFRLLTMRRVPASRLVGVLVTVALLPGAVLTWADLAVYRLTEPVWPLWRWLTPVVAPLLFVILLTGLIVIAWRQRPAPSLTGAKAAGQGSGPAGGSAD
jgi:hypothetical protein